MTSDLVKRLRAPAYWFSGSDEGHEGENSAPYEAADRIEQLEAALRDLLRLVEEDPEEDDPSPYLFDQVCDRARAALDYRQRDDRT